MACSGNQDRIFHPLDQSAFRNFTLYCYIWTSSFVHPLISHAYQITSMDNNKWRPLKICWVQLLSIKPPALVNPYWLPITFTIDFINPPKTDVISQPFTRLPLRTHGFLSNSCSRDRQSSLLDAKSVSYESGEARVSLLNFLSEMTRIWDEKPVLHEQTLFDSRSMAKSRNVLNFRLYPFSTDFF